MADTRIQLGDFVFADMEVPEVMPLGGSQRLAVHNFPGGARTIQAMGSDHAPIQWSGLMLGGTALARANTLDAMRILGAAVPLSFFDSLYSVVIERFEFRVEKYYKVAYSITCAVASYDSAPAAPRGTTSFDGGIATDAAQMNLLGNKIGDGILSGALSSLSSAIASVSSFATAASSQIAGVTGAIGSVTARVNTLTASARNTINSVTTPGGILPNNPLAVQSDKLLSHVSAMTNYPILQNITSLSARMTRNVTMGSLSGSSRTVQAGGGTLFDVAQQQYGDATLWPAIAKASGLVDTAISGIKTLVVPNNPPASGGVVS